MSKEQEWLRHEVIKAKCEESHLFFTRYHFKIRQQNKFRVNWHHHLIADVVDDIIHGRRKNVVINVSPGGTKTELVVINLIARGLALNPRARFLHLSGSETLALLNSATARDLVSSPEYQEFWPLQLSADSQSKKRWNVVLDGKEAGGVYATAIGGQVTGFRAGHMAEGFQGAIIIDDPIKPGDAFSRTTVDAANASLLTTINSRKANPETPIILIMQRVAENDPSGFILKGGVPGHFDHVKIPAVLTQEFVDTLPEKYKKLIEPSEIIDNQFSYWPYKEPIKELLEMKKGGGKDKDGQRISQYVYSSQYAQEPKSLGGNIIKGANYRFFHWDTLPKMRYRMIYGDTAQKTKEYNDYSVFLEAGLGVDGWLYFLDLLRGRWEAPDLQQRAVAFWKKCKERKVEQFGVLRKMKIEDKSSGTGLIQTIKHPPYNILIEGIERDKDKVTRTLDMLPYQEAGMIFLPYDAPWTPDFISENESFTANDSHDFDDQVDVECDAASDMLGTGNKLKQWIQLGKKAESES